MKIVFSYLVVMATVAVASGGAYANEHHGGGRGPCAPLWKACTAAGKKGPDTKSCIETLKSGGTVEGVTASDTDVAACKAAPEHKHKHEKKAASSEQAE